MAIPQELLSIYSFYDLIKILKNMKFYFPAKEKLYTNYSKMSSSFQNGKIYRLICDDGHYYIGSTINTLEYRLKGHKYMHESTQKVYKYINSIGWEYVKIELIENYPCANREELLIKEDFYICMVYDDPLNLNTQRAFMSVDEKKEYNRKYYEFNKEVITINNKIYYENNKDAIMEYHKEYNEINKDKVDQYHTDYRLINAEKRGEYTKKYIKEHPEWNLEYQQKYYKENKEKIKETNKKYIEANKEIVAERKRTWVKKRKDFLATDEKAIKQKEELLKLKEEKRKIHKAEYKAENERIIICECGGSYQPYRKSRHDSNKKHQAFVRN